MDYYTNVRLVGNNILFRGIVDGQRKNLKLKYKPTLYEITKNVSEFKTLDDKKLRPIVFDSIREAKDFCKKFEDVSNKKIYGQTSYEYAFIAETYPNDVEWSIKDVVVSFIDIEVSSENGFPDPHEAKDPITALTYRILGSEKKYIFGCGDYKAKETEIYFKCEHEYDLCKKFLSFFQNDYPDIISGWNIKFFDVIYLINRFNRILGESECKKMSPWGIITDRQVSLLGGKSVTVYNILGIEILDYLELYKKYATGRPENNKLDTVASLELNENKLSYSDYGSLDNLYKQNYQLFIEYNVKDVDLLIRLEEKLKLIELALALAYDTKSNYSDVFMQTVMWDNLIYSYLLKKNIIIPPKESKDKSDAFEGAYVKEPQVGLHNWVASFDLNSLYPHLMMQYNLSPETLISPENYTEEMNEIISQNINVDKLLHKQIDLSKLNGVTVTPNGQFFNTKFRGFLPEMLEGMYNDRKKYKKLMLEAEQDYENEKDETKKREIENRISKYRNYQLAKKVSLNSAYGVTGSKYFRFFDLRLALSVTLAGQLSIRWIEEKLNKFFNDLLKTNSDYVIASDTDSIYLKFETLIDKVFKNKNAFDVEKIIDFMDKVCEEKLQPYIDESYQELADYVHAYEQKMQMKREVLANKGIWIAKKRYILNVYNNEGVKYKEPHLKVMGLEMVKSSTPTVVRDKMKDIIGIIVNKDENSVQKFISDFREDFKKLKPEDVSFPRGVSEIEKSVNEETQYNKGTPIHVKGSIIYNNLLKAYSLDKKYDMIRGGDKIKFVYLKMPNPIKSPVISFPSVLPKEFNLDSYIDYDTQFSKTFLSPIEDILNCLNWKSEQQNSLDDFFV